MSASVSGISGEKDCYILIQFENNKFVSWLQVIVLLNAFVELVRFFSLRQGETNWLYFTLKWQTETL